jgi:hypothetical protein
MKVTGRRLELVTGRRFRAHALRFCGRESAAQIFFASGYHPAVTLHKQ